MEYLTLRQLAGVIKLAVAQQTEECWVVAEVAQLNVNRKSGHCYLELIEKSEEKTVAQMKAAIWAGAFVSIGAEFKAKTGMPLQAGMKVLMLARPTFHEVYGLSLTITAIDPSYTLGEMAMKRRETIERLTKEGVIDLNRRLPLPPVLQRIAVISSSTAAGYGDFMSRLGASPYSFSVSLFEAYMQGERAERSLLSALDMLKKDAANYDALVIIRGGGAQADLQCFDGYAIAREVAMLPLPVLAGIGHERDETVVDRVAHMRLITPTAAAEFIISRARDFEARVDALSSGLARFAERLIRDERRSVESHGRLLGSAVRNYLASRGHELSAIARRFEHSAVRDLTGRTRAVEKFAMLMRLHGLAYLRRRGEELGGLETRARLLDPANVLKRGYSITTMGGRAVADASALRKGDIINTRLYRGSVNSVVEGPLKEREDVG